MSSEVSLIQTQTVAGLRVITTVSRLLLLVHVQCRVQGWYGYEG